MQITWRPATREDLPRIEQLWAEQDERFSGSGAKVDRPVLFYEEDEEARPFYPYKPPVLNVVVAEKAGEVVGFRYTEAVPEMSIVTGDKDVMESLGSALTHEAHWLKQKGFRSGWGLVPQKFVGAMGRFLRRYPHIRPWRSLTPVGIDFSELGD
jgi:hypothetical protein